MSAPTPFTTARDALQRALRATIDGWAALLDAAERATDPEGRADIMGAAEHAQALARNVERLEGLAGRELPAREEAAA